MSLSAQGYDVAVVGAGPVGSFCALAYARRGARVVLLEANPRASQRLAGEWLHPPAARMLHDAGIRLDGHPTSTAGKGFAVFPEDGSEPITLPYPGGSLGLTCEHAAIVSSLRDAAAESGVEFMPHVRVRTVEDGGVAFSSHDGGGGFLEAARIVGADGRASIVRQSLGLPTGRVTCSRMVGVTVAGAALPLEGYGHVLLGAPGQILMYRLGEQCVRIIVDVPLEGWRPGDRKAFLSDSYAAVLPATLRPAFVEAIGAGRIDAAANEVRPRVTYGSSKRVLIGDAAGHFHPMTAVGMTLGFGDALALAESGDFDAFTNSRGHATRAPELLAMGLYEVFADHRPEAVALRRAVYRGWRTNPRFRDRSARLLACEDTSTVRLAVAFAGTVAQAVTGELPSSGGRLPWRSARDILGGLAVRLGWFLRGVQGLPGANSMAAAPDGADRERGDRARELLSRALLTSMPERPASTDRPRRAGPHAPARDAGPALERATVRLLELQGEDGGWEGELVWCPLLTAQYVLICHLVGHPLDARRRRRLLRYFRRTRLENGAWGFFEGSPPHLFVTTLVYIAARSLGTQRDDPLVVPARAFLQAERVTSIPGWGKFWLALLNLYGWQGVNPVLPELWALPRWVPLHPSNWYGFTRLIYTGLAAIYLHRFQAPVTPLIAALRAELYPQGYADIDFAATRNRVRPAELHVRPGLPLRAAFAFARWFDRFRDSGLRARCMETIYRQITWELRATNHASQSPLNGLPNILALWLRDPHDSDLHEALAQMDRWLWEDDERGARVALQRSASWDTGFALQALATVPAHARVADALRRGTEFLRGQQLGPGYPGFREASRTDPEGGWSLGRPWQRWPLIDCTAEAALGIMTAPLQATDTRVFDAAVRFMLDGQNRDGGFASYEARRYLARVEWLNSSEMFTDVMNERSYVECTASCLAALAACRKRCPSVRNQAVASAISRGNAWLRREQSSDGSWAGNWGVHYIYGTLFGIRGLVAAGAGPGDPALRLACRWLLDHQRSDGGWGEHHSGCLAGRYVPREESQVLQTAWASMALLEAEDSDWAAISRGIRFLLDTQEADGTWPREEAAGVFGRTGLLDYSLYRQYFPLHALGLYEQRRQRRLACTAAPFPLPTRATDDGDRGQSRGALQPSSAIDQDGSRGYVASSD